MDLTENVFAMHSIMCESLLPLSLPPFSLPPSHPQVAEMLYWAAEQNEEKSPELTRFTMHFNNVSQW